MRLPPGPLVVASHNPGKVREIIDLLGPYGFDIRSAAELGLPEPEETGETFEANAILKARAAAETSGLPSLADDSGLAVEALGGDPGIYSARWAGPDKDFARAMRLVEEKLQEAGAARSEQRRAHFVSVLALALPDGSVEAFEGRVDGNLVWPPRGDQGFGYDPMFLPGGHNRTFGEMSAEEKHGWRPGQGEGLSHRARAFRLFAREVLGRDVRSARTEIRFVWDERKRIRNLSEHGLDFADIDAHFRLAEALIVPSYPSPDGRPRFLAIGRFGGMLASLVFSPLGTEAFSVISFRRSSRKERRAYAQR